MPMKDKNPKPAPTPRYAQIREAVMPRIEARRRLQEQELVEFTSVDQLMESVRKDR